MGNCASIKKKDKENSSDNRTTDDKPNDDVMYASINLENAKTSRQARNATDDDCDYATVNIPAALQPRPESECSSKEECADDYVLMG